MYLLFAVWCCELCGEWLATRGPGVLDVVFLKLVGSSLLAGGGGGCPGWGDARQRKGSRLYLNVVQKLLVYLKF